MSERRKITTLIGKPIARIQYDETGYICFIDPAGNVLMRVKDDDLFDADGNYFITADLP